VSISGSCWAAVWGDFDNDGYLDLYITNAGDTGQGTGDHNFLFHNNGNGTFTDVAATTGAALQDDVALHKGAAWVDFDNDGFLDLTVKDGIGNETDNGPAAIGLHRLLRNGGNGNHYLEINLRGVQSNARGIGARVTVTSSNGVAYRQNNGGGGGEYASQGSQPLHFGLGTATSATVVVNWPSGVVDTLQDVPVNQIITATEGSSSQTPTPTPNPTPSPTPTPSATATPTLTPTPTPTATIQVRVQTNPAGLAFIVDGTTYPQSGGTGVQYAWQRWSDNGAISHTVAPTTKTNYTATFTTQYYLTTTAGTGGRVRPASGWRKSGASVSISATPDSGYSFSDWTGTGTGSYSGPDNPASIIMNGPISETAAFTFTHN